MELVDSCERLSGALEVGQDVGVSRIGFVSMIGFGNRKLRWMAGYVKKDGSYSIEGSWHLGYITLHILCAFQPASVLNIVTWSHNTGFIANVDVCSPTWWTNEPEPPGTMMKRRLVQLYWV
jgi:hypothetical protein